MRFVAGMEGGESARLLWRGDLSTVVGMARWCGEGDAVSRGALRGGLLGRRANR